MKVLILGSGFIGSALMCELKQRGVLVAGASRSPTHPDVTKANLVCDRSLRTLLHLHKPDVVVNCSGLAGFTRCETEPQLSMELNVVLSSQIANFAQEYGYKYAFFSSSYVFEGSQGMHLEDENVNPTSVYGLHKVLAENYIQKNLKDFLIIRLDTVFAHDKFTGKARVGGGLLRGIIPLVPGRFIRTPICLNAVAELVSDLVLSTNIGIYHVSGETLIGLKEFYKALQKELGIEVRFKYLRRDEVIITPPENTSLSTSKVKSLGLKVPRYADSWF